MYGKWFRSMYEGSMYGAGVSVFAVWGYVIANTIDSRIELNPKKLADTLGGEVNEVHEAIEFLTKPDPDSRNKAHDGRRLVREGEFQYFVPSWEEYQRIKNEEDRREYNRMKQAEWREKQKAKRLKRGKPLPNEVSSVKFRDNGDDALADALAEERMPSAASEASSVEGERDGGPLPATESRPAEKGVPEGAVVGPVPGGVPFP